jgi:hypothetical protein
MGACRPVATAVHGYLRQFAMSDLGTFDAKMIDLQQQVAIAYAAEMTKLRQENAALRKTIAAFPSTASELQDRVTMLECRLLASHEPPNVGAKLETTAAPK